MNYKTLISFSIFIGINGLYLFAAYFFRELPYQNLILLADCLLIIILMLAFTRKQSVIQMQQKLNGLPVVPHLVEPANTTDELFIDHFPNFLCLKDKNGRWLRASELYLASFNLQGVDYKGKNESELAQHPGSNVRALRLSSIQDKSAWHLKRPVNETRIVVRKNKSDEILEITRTPVFDNDKKKLKLILTGYFVDQVEKDKSNKNAKRLRRLEHISYAFQACHLSFVFLDAHFKIMRVNQAFTRLTGYAVEELRGKHFSFIIDDGFDIADIDFLKDENQLAWSGELLCRHKDDTTFPVKLDITMLTKENENVGYFASLSDITRQKQSEKRIMQIAHYDDLTGLVNRVMFFDRLNQFLAESKRHQLHAVVFFIDLDRFKAVNDSLGHDAGNFILKETASRLLSVMRAEDVVARLSGDEFALLLLNEKVHEQAIYSAALIAGKIIQVLSEAFYIQGREVFIGASIGIAIYPEDGVSAESLLKRADIAMYEAKKQGRNNYQFYKKDYTLASEDRLLMELSLRKAIEKNELQLYYQPQYYAASRKLFGAEVLVRWIQVADGKPKMIPPDYFIAIAEESGLIMDIGQWILRSACKQLKAWLEKGYPLEQVSVNVSTRQFTDNNFLGMIEDALKEANLAPKHLELEITESVLIGDIKQIELQLQRLKKMGITIALDDFGTGYSSLSYLKNFPIDVLKIDQSFIREMTVESKDARLASAIIDMGHSLGQKIIAEGVETEQQLMYLAHRGCDFIQGYYLSPPLPENKMTTLLISEVQSYDTTTISKKHKAFSPITKAD